MSDHLPTNVAEAAMIAALQEDTVPDKKRHKKMTRAEKKAEKPDFSY